MKYTNLSLVNAKAALSTYTSAVAGSTEPLTAAQKAEVSMDSAFKVVKNLDVGKSKAISDKEVKTTLYN